MRKFERKSTYKKSNKTSENLNITNNNPNETFKIPDENIVKVENFPTENGFDLYYHLKYNIKNNEIKCEIHDSDLTAYCVVCKRNICDVCMETVHSSHNFIRKDDIKITPEYIRGIFKCLEETLKETETLVQPSKLICDIKQKTEDEFLEIESKLNILKEKRLKEIDNMFDSPSTDTKQIKKILDKTKKSLITYISNYKDFIDFNKHSDENNILFLPLFDLLNEIFIKKNEYFSIMDELKKLYKVLSQKTETKYQEINDAIEQVLQRQKREDINLVNLGVVDAEIANAPKRDECKQKFTQQFAKLNEDLFYDLRNKISLYQSHFDTFTNYCYESVKKSGNLQELDKIVKIFDEKTSKKVNYSSNQMAGVRLSYSSKSRRGFGTSPSKKNSILVNQEMQNNQIINKKDKELCGIKEQIEEVIPETQKLVRHNKNDSNISNNSSINEAENNEIKKENGTDQINNNTIKELNEDTIDANNQKIKNNLNEIKEEIFVDINANQKKKIKNERLTKDQKKLNTMFKPKQQYINSNQFNTNVPVKSELKNEKSNTKRNETLSTIENKSAKRKENKSEKKDNSTIHNQSSHLSKNQRIIENMKEIEYQSSLIKSKEDISLSIPIIKKYFAYNTLEFLGKNLATLSNSKGSTMVGLFDTIRLETNISEADHIRVIEGTNEITIYSREKRKIIKKKINLDIITFGTTKFPIGCRYLLNSGNIYISGGKDMKGDKSIFWCYNIKEDKIQKLKDSNYGHSYHTIFYHDNFRSLVIIGGENNPYCEMYDLYLNIWTTLPELIVPRAKVNIYLDKIGMYAYAIFGIEGSINSGSFSDAIEVLNMIDPTQGWAKIEYNKKSLVDLKQGDLKVYELSQDKLIFYGAVENRDLGHCYIIFDLRTFDLYQIEKDCLEQLKVDKSLPVEFSLNTKPPNLLNTSIKSPKK